MPKGGNSFQFLGMIYFMPYLPSFLLPYFMSFFKVHKSREGLGKLTSLLHWGPFHKELLVYMYTRVLMAVTAISFSLSYFYWPFQTLI